MTSNTRAAYLTKLQDSYTPREYNKLDALKRLDKKAKRPARVVSSVFGTLWGLVLGFGMAISIGAIPLSMTMGIIIGCIGLAGCIINVFCYRALLKAGKSKYANKILTLSNELMNERGTSVSLTEDYR